VSGDGLLSHWRLTQAASQNRALSRTDVAVLMVVLNRINTAADSAKHGAAWPSLRTIATDASVDRSSATRSIRRLVHTGYLLRESGNRTKSNTYRVGLGRCEPAPRCKPAPRCEPARGVGANLPSKVGANLRPDLAYKNLPIESTPSTEANASDAARPVDLWTDGIALLTSTGTKREQAGATIGKLRKELGEDEAVKVIAQMLAIRPTGPRAYLHGVIKYRTKGMQAGRLPKDSRSEDAIADANQAALQRLGMPA
jgi:hypothetical protein